MDVKVDEEIKEQEVKLSDSHASNNLKYEPNEQDKEKENSANTEHLKSDMTDSCSTGDDQDWKMCSICSKMFPAEKVFQHMNNCYRLNQTSKYSKNSFQCDQCDKILNCIGSLNQHLKSQHQNIYYKCSFCLRKLRNSYSLEKHVLEFHIGNSNMTNTHRFPCPECNRYFTRNWCVKSHMKAHETSEHITCSTCKETKYSRKEYEAHTSKQTECSICQLKMCNKKYLKTHILTHTGSVDLKCGVCGEIFYIKSILRAHEQMHQNSGVERTFSCVQCKKLYKTAMAASSCPRRHSGLWKCTECDRNFLGPKELERHKARHDENREMFPCLKCQMSFVSKPALDGHNKKKHEEGKTYFPCNVCNQNSASFDSLQHHMKYNHPKVFYECNFCAFTTRTLIKVKTHTEKLHKEDEGLPILPKKIKRVNCKPKSETTCNVCGKQVKCSNYLKLHMKIHTGQKDILCPKCPLTSYRKSVIKGHLMKIHKFTKLQVIEAGLYCKPPKDTSDPKSYTCTICDYQTTVRGYLHMHERKHTGERPFSCPNCELKFTRKFVLREHCKRIHSFTKESLVIAGI